MSKIKISASKRDDILRRKAEYEKDYDQRKAKYDDQRRNYEIDESRIFAKMENEIRNQLGDSFGELIINITQRFKGIELEIGNTLGGPRRDPNASLSWSWRAKLDENGNLTKESSSWSGLQATTLEQIEDLKLCVHQLEIINAMDWAHILDVTLPNYDDYITEHNPDFGPKPNFNAELLEADIEDCIGQNILIAGLPRTTGRYFGNPYYGIIKDSGSQYTVTEIPGSAVDKGSEEIMKYLNQVMPYRIKKSTFKQSIKTPIETIEY